MIRLTISPSIPMPMTKDSTSHISTLAESAHMSATGPRVTTVNFIRQFSRACVAVSGIGLNTMMCN